MTGIFTATKSNSPEVACVGKSAFKTRALAAEVAARANTSATVLPYHCPSCGAWHCGTLKKASKLPIPKHRKSGRGPRRLDMEEES